MESRSGLSLTTASMSCFLVGERLVVTAGQGLWLGHRGWGPGWENKPHGWQFVYAPALEVTLPQADMSSWPCASTAGGRAPCACSHWWR